MYLCYIDESGGFEAPRSGPGATPLMLFAALIIEADRISALTKDFLGLKKRFYPGKADKHLDFLRAEVKGAELRAAVRSTSRRKRSHALAVLDATVDLLEAHHVRILGRVWIKEVGVALDPKGSYLFAMQDLARHFDHFLAERHTSGLILCDGRLHKQDALLSHSLFTRKYKASGDALPNLVEPTVFGQSENHAGLQLADIVASALFFPMAARAYCTGYIPGNDMRRRVDVVGERYGARLKALRYTYKNTEGKRLGGVVVSDKLGHRPSSALFEPPEA